MAELISAIDEAIEDDDRQELATLFTSLDLAQLTLERQWALLNHFGRVASAYQRPEMMLMIVDKWADVNIPESNGPVDYYSYLVLEPTVDPEVIYYIAVSDEDINFFSAVSDLLRTGSSDRLLTAIERVQSIFGVQSADIYQTLMSEANDRNNISGYNWLFDRFSEVSPNAPIPVWIRADDQLPEYTVESIEGTFDLTQIDEMIDRLLEGMRDQGWVVENTPQNRELIRARIQVADPEERRNLLMPLLTRGQYQEMQTDRAVFRELGPDNPAFDADPAEVAKGRYRMFINIDRELDPDTDEQLPDWFTGVCENCGLGIRKRWYAIRMPMEGGGWVGCYHSEDCVRRKIQEEEMDNGVNIMRETMLDVVMTQLREFGIRDRD